MKHYSPTGRRIHGRLLKRLLDAWDRNGSTSSPTQWHIYIWWWWWWMMMASYLCSSSRNTSVSVCYKSPFFIKYLKSLFMVGLVSK
jgi:hypothetical protein